MKTNATGAAGTGAMGETKGGIWLEVVEVSYEGGHSPSCAVLLKGDQQHPKPVWWPISDQALGAAKQALDAYRAVVQELRDKRVVLARLSWNADPKRACLECDVLTFQSTEPGNR